MMWINFGNFQCNLAEIGARGEAIVSWRCGVAQGMQNRAKANGESVHIAEKPKSWPELCAAGQRKQATMQQPNWAPTADCTKNSWAAAGEEEGGEEGEGDVDGAGNRIGGKRLRGIWAKV